MVLVVNMTVVCGCCAFSPKTIFPGTLEIVKWKNFCYCRIVVYLEYCFGEKRDFPRWDHFIPHLIIGKFKKKKFLKDHQWSIAARLSLTWRFRPSEGGLSNNGRNASLVHFIDKGVGRGLVIKRFNFFSGKSNGRWNWWCWQLIWRWSVVALHPRRRRSFLPLWR